MCPPSAAKSPVQSRIQGMLVPPPPSYNLVMQSKPSTLIQREDTDARFDPYQRASGPGLARVAGGITDCASGRWHVSALRHALRSVRPLSSAQQDRSFELDAA